MTTETMAGMKIGEFITARLDEEEQDAQVAAGPSNLARWAASWIPGAQAAVGWEVHCGKAPGPGWTLASALRAPFAKHVARQDPAATLARVEALRKTVDVLTSAASLNPEHDLARLTGAMALRHVAAIWRTHPDYREEWAP